MSQWTIGLYILGKIVCMKVEIWHNLLLCIQSPRKRELSLTLTMNILFDQKHEENFHSSNVFVKDRHF